MIDILNPKVQASGLFDVIGIGISKAVTERVLAPIIGNASVKSGIIKIIGGSIIHGKDKYLNYVSGGLVIDGVEDIVQSLIIPAVGGMVPGGQNQEAAW
jgi:hypothetical protein